MSLFSAHEQIGNGTEDVKQGVDTGEEEERTASIEVVLVNGIHPSGELGNDEDDHHEYAQSVNDSLKDPIGRGLDVAISIEKNAYIKDGAENQTGDAEEITENDRPACGDAGHSAEDSRKGVAYCGNEGKQSG